jgi:hypothetical protein
VAVVDQVVLMLLVVLELEVLEELAVVVLEEQNLLVMQRLDKLILVAAVAAVVKTDVMDNKVVVE